MSPEEIYKCSKRLRKSAHVELAFVAADTVLFGLWCIVLQYFLGPSPIALNLYGFMIGVFMVRAYPHWKEISSRQKHMNLALKEIQAKERAEAATA